MAVRPMQCRTEHLRELVEIDRTREHRIIDIDDILYRTRFDHGATRLGKRVVDFPDASLEALRCHAGNAGGMRARSDRDDDLRLFAQLFYLFDGFFSGYRALDDRDIELFWHRLARGKLPVFKIDAPEDIGEEMLLIGDLQLTAEAARQAHDHDAQRLLFSAG